MHLPVLVDGDAIPAFNLTGEFGHVVTWFALSGYTDTANPALIFEDMVMLNGLKFAASGACATVSVFV